MEKEKSIMFPPMNWDGFTPEIRALIENYFEPKFNSLLEQECAILEKLESHNAKKSSKQEG